jgi:hypothetical protein
LAARSAAPTGQHGEGARHRGVQHLTTRGREFVQHHLADEIGNDVPPGAAGCGVFLPVQHPGDDGRVDEGQEFLTRDRPDLQQELGVELPAGHHDRLQQLRHALVQPVHPRTQHPADGRGQLRAGPGAPVTGQFEDLGDEEGVALATAVQCRRLTLVGLAVRKPRGGAPSHQLVDLRHGERAQRHHGGTALPDEQLQKFAQVLVVGVHRRADDEDRCTAQQ